MDKKIRLVVMIATAALTIVFGTRAFAQQDPPKAAPAGVAGNWSLVVAAQDGTITAGMSLKQDGQKVTGTFTSDHTGEVAVDGQYVDGTLSFTIALHGGNDPSMKIDFTGKLKTDGSLAGSLTGPMGDMEWTASRVK